jgi:hypothetical protein
MGGIDTFEICSRIQKVLGNRIRFLSVKELNMTVSFKHNFN